jgi:hypothetical protein
LQESLSVAHRTGAIDTKDLERVAHPTDARLTHRAIEKLVELAKRKGVELRQSYAYPNWFKIWISGPGHSIPTLHSATSWARSGRRTRLMARAAARSAASK